MTKPAQLGPLLENISSQLGVSPQDLEERGRQSRLTMAATIAAARSGCDCDACQLLRQFSDKLVSDALREVAPNGEGTNPQP